MIRALDYYVAFPDEVRAVAIGGYPLSTMPGHEAGATELVARAMPLVTPDSPEEGQLLARYCSVLGIEQADYDGAQQAASRALSLARNEGNESLEMRTLVAATQVEWWHLRWQQCIDRSLRVLELARRADDPFAETRGHITSMNALATIGDREGLNRHAPPLLEVLERSRTLNSVTSGLMAITNMQRLEGHWETARQTSDQALAKAPNDAPLLASRIILEYEVGDFPQGGKYLGSLLDLMHASSPGPTWAYSYPAQLIPLVARITGLTDDLDTAEAAAESCFSSKYITPHIAWWARVGLGLIAVHRGDATGAEKQYRQLNSMTGVTTRLIAADRWLGLLSQTMRNVDKAAAHFEDALVFCRRAGYRPELAWTCCDYSDVLRERDGDGDHAKAISLLDKSLAISSELGMRPLMERGLSRREILKA